MYYNGGNEEEAISNILTGLKRGADESGEIWLTLARCHVKLWSKTNQISHLEESNKYYQKAVSYPYIANNPDILYEVADGYIKYGSYENGLILLSKVLSEYPKHNKLNIYI